MKEKVIAVFVYTRDDDRTLDEQQQEFLLLIEAADADVVAVVTQKVDKYNPATLIGSGKVVEVADLVKNLEAETVCFNHQLTGSQIKNLEDAMDCKIIDRTHVILDIFAKRASDKEGKLQVKLAQLSYRLPRLQGHRSYLSRLGGGIGTRGPGEQQLETDRRHIEREMASIKSQLEQEAHTRSMKAKRRSRNLIPIVAFVGYTNVGKSTILNQVLQKSFSALGKEVSAKNRLFETLTPAHRMVVLPGGAPCILMDTVGFVSNLPTELVAAFESTLEVLQEADVIYHIMDASSPMQEIQVETTNALLKNVGVEQTLKIVLWNKMDQTKEVAYENFGRKDRIYISAKKDEDILRLMEHMKQTIYPQGPVTWAVSYHDFEELKKELATIPPEDIQYEADCVQVTFYASEALLGRLGKRIAHEAI